ncbi:MAG: GLPGLI family protein [Bacteroidetes bacterium]|nr:GLPGLI family protein [Bacteroidota bacterium]
MQKDFSKGILWLLLLILGGGAQAQIITEGRILFERKTNLEKKFNDERMRRFMGNEKNKTEEFELIFNDTISIFKPILSDAPDNFSWATTRNTMRQNFNTNEKVIVLELAGQKVFVKDTNTLRAWKITDSKRNIGKYNCRKAIYEPNDSTRIYAWYSVDIVPSVGPEGYFGLPGAILGLATEDGSIVYFAKDVQIVATKKEEFNIDLPKKDVYTLSTLRELMEKQLGGQSWGKRILEDAFQWL